jgi:chromosome segregation ATPase
MSLTDEIYQELLDRLDKGLDWPKFLAKHSASKGPLYNAVTRFFNEVGSRVLELNEELRLVQNKLEQAGRTMDSLDQKVKAAESNIINLEDKGKGLDQEVEALEAKFYEKAELLKYMEELERLGFDGERLNMLARALEEIGTRHGLRGKQTVENFFNDLKNYGAVLGLKLQLEGLQTQIETSKLQADNWRAKEEALKRKHDDLNKAVKAVHALRSRGIKVAQITSWHRILSQFETVEQFEQYLTRYGDVTKLVEAKKEEAENWESKRVKAQSQVETLEKRRARVEAAIEVQKEAGIKELKDVAAAQTEEIRSVSQEARSQFGSLTSQIDALFEKVFELGQKFERMKLELQEYEGIKDILESHSASSEEEQ